MIAACFGQCLLYRLVIALEDQCRVIAQFPKVLQRLEDVLLITLAALIRSTYNILRGCMGVRLREIVVHVLLDVGKFAIIVLDDLRRQIVQDVFLQSTK